MHFKRFVSLTLGCLLLAHAAWAENQTCDVNDSGTFNIIDIIDMVSALLDPIEDPVTCVGPQCICDPTEDNDTIYDEGFSDGEASVDITSNDSAVCDGCTQSGYEAGAASDRKSRTLKLL